MRSFLYNALLVCCVMLLGACSEDDTDAEEDWLRLPAVGLEKCEDFLSYLTVKDRMQQEEAAFTPGEPVTFEKSITNTSTSNAHTLTTPDACTGPDFQILNSQNRTVWSSLDATVCAQVVTTLSYASNETRVFTVQWNQRLRDGSQAPSGRYTLQSVDRTECSAALDHAAEFRIQ